VRDPHRREREREETEEELRDGYVEPAALHVLDDVPSR